MIIFPELYFCIAPPEVALFSINFVSLIVTGVVISKYNAPPQPVLPVPLALLPVKLEPLTLKVPLSTQKAPPVSAVLLMNSESVIINLLLLSW